MYLKSLEIQGFKSFPDKISLTFDKGLTAVVGPNGSGKSNIGDSVRWVLGEQSTKTLRGNKMEDVIFSGTVARKPMGFASVTLNIDNSDGSLANLEDDVSVTRKIYRSGESEYSVNGKSCRLKDINELFMDTGLGRDGYSIIGQGRIAEIVGAKSNERRDIFEEAAGISKFRYKKSEAERRLKSAQENILRLTDIIAELKQRVEPLKIQAEKAQKFIELAEERKKLEISVWITQLDELKQKIEILNDKVLISRSEYENTENDIANEEEKLQSSYRRMQECTMKSDEIRRKMIAEEQEASQKKSDIAVYENDISHCYDAIKKAEKSIKQSAQTRHEYQLAIEELEKKITALEEQKSQLKIEIDETELKSDSAKEKNLQLGRESDKLSNKINGLYIKQNELKFTAESAEKTVSDEEKHLEELLSGSNDIEKNIAGYNKQIAKNRASLKNNHIRTEELKNKISGLEKLYNSRKSGFDNTKEEFEKIFYELRNNQQKRKILSDLENSMEGFTGSVKQVLKASKQGRISGILGTIAQNISVEKQYAVAVETALGGAMQNIIVENEDIAKRCIRFLKEQKGGRATFLPITSVKGYELAEQGLENCTGFIEVASKIVSYDERFSRIISSLLGRIVIADDIDSATQIAKKYNYKFRIVTLDGQVINSGGSFTGGSVQKSVGIITRKNEIEILDTEIESLTKQREILNTKMDKLRAESEKLRYETESARAELRELESMEVRLNAEVSSLESLILQLNTQTQNSDKQIEEVRRKIQSAEQLEIDTKKSAEVIEVQIRTAEENLMNIQNSRENLRLERAEFSEIISSLKIRDMELSKDIQAQQSEISHINSELASLDNGNKYFEDEIINHNKVIAEKQKEISRLASELENTKNNSETYISEIQYYQNLHTEQNRLVNEIQKGIKQLNESKEKLSAEITRLEERRESVNRDYDTVIRQLSDVYELTYSEAVKFAVKVDDIISTQSELMAVKNKIRALGSVNVSAVDEYHEVSERYEFLSSQLADVQKSKDELENIIENLTSEMCRIFSESFQIINTNFNEIFMELFGGGKAELILTDPENVLESGIEISVAPPGKVIKNLISLSGGEQSFIAIAIYFSILKLRPAPFCILDEIDAALDEVNVRKYAQYLKKFTKTTQFVLVTHRRSAMEEANVLYGVTMQEDGISKLLKMEQVDFQEDTSDIQ
ncbi:MAG: chromosome segregation protein SMC [Ruminococcus sp.]|nr:chromosome segregation protein SMC [Ruminococcus sp.]